MQTNKQRPIDEEINSRLYTWFLEQEAHGQSVTDTLLLAKAVEICKSLGGTPEGTFTGSENWLQDFKKRYKINDIKDQVAPDLSVRIVPGMSTNAATRAIVPAKLAKINGILISVPRTPVVAATRAATSTNATMVLPTGANASPINANATQYLKLCINPPMLMNPQARIKTPIFVNPPRYVNMSTYTGSFTFTNPVAAGSNVELNAAVSSGAMNASVPKFVGAPAANATVNVLSCSQAKANAMLNVPSCSQTKANAVVTKPSRLQAKANAAVDATPVVAVPRELRNVATKSSRCSNEQLFLKDFARRLAEEKISSRNIYYLKDTVLAWKLIPEKLLEPGMKDRHIELKFEKERVTIGLCVSACGSHKLAPLFIYKRERPKALKHCKDRLPVVFATQPQAQMDHVVFMEWYNKHFKPTVKILQFPDKGGKVLLLLDYHQKHRLQLVKEQDNDNFEIVFLPECVASLMQSIEEKVVERVKKIYRLKMLRQMLNFPEGTRRFCHDFDLKDCIDLFSAAWTEITAANIQNAWSGILKKNRKSVLIKEESMGDPLELTLQDIVGLNPGEEQSEETINEFLLQCQETERRFVTDEMEEDGDEDVEEEDNSESESEGVILNEENIKWAFETLLEWSKHHPQYIQLQVEYLKNYYEKSILGKQMGTTS
ncbi:uncharacterized protein LOC144478910 [Augochlora pura]